MMWPRTAEVMLGLWLAASPFIFGHPPDAILLWSTDLVCGFLVITISLVSHSVRFRRLHLVNTAFGAALIVIGYLGTGPNLPPAHKTSWRWARSCSCSRFYPARPRSRRCLGGIHALEFAPHGHLWLWLRRAEATHRPGVPWFRRAAKAIR